jgi:uncharacterized membrane protein
MRYVSMYFATAVPFWIADLLWLGVVARTFYRDSLGSLMANPIDLKAAIAFYLIFPIGIVIFAVAPAFASGGAAHALLMGALFGFFCYATYDLTNLATLKNWPLKMSLVDMVWGTVLTGASAWAGYQLTRLFA